MAMHPVPVALGWALLHSLWQGALLALLAAGFLGLARRQAPETRYRIACAALALMVMAFLGTLAWHWDRGNAVVLGSLRPVPVEGRGLADPSAWARIRPQLEALLPWASMAWCLGCLVMAGRFGAALSWTYGPCLRRILPVPAVWEARFASLQARVGMSRPVRLAGSLLVDSPMVLGWLKPVVLVPAAAFAAMSPEALEALLVHELAHVRRGDFLANLLQSLAEVLFFYHPAAWWLSRQVRQERENCCDDAAVRACGDPILYASALARLEEIRTTILIPELAPAASGGRLMSRIQRLIQPHPATATGLRGILSITLLTSALGATALLAGGKPPAKPATPKATAASPAPADLATEPAAPVETDFARIKVKHQPKAPEYPATAKLAKIQGTVVVNLTVDAEGKVTEAKAVSGPEELRSTAEAYAREWRFHPFKVKGKPVPVRFKLTMPFKLR